MNIKTIFEDKNILVVCKPNNLSSQKDKRGNEGLLEILQKQHKQLYIINRLDTNVSGLVLFGKTKEASQKLSLLVQNKEIEKIYYAVIDGNIKNSDILENWLFKNQRLNISKVVYKNSPNAKIAKLKYEKLKSFEYDNNTYSYVKINLETGRHHQIRVQFSNICNGLYGDSKYNLNFKRSRDNIALCAKELKFKNPFTKEQLHLKCDLPNEEIWNKF